MPTSANTSALTLSKAARISPFVTETTIGAYTSSPHHVTPTRKQENAQNNETSNKWKLDVWHRVDLEKEKTSCLKLNVMDCKVIQMKMALKNAEKMRQKQVRLEMAQRQKKLNDLEEMMENMKISNLERSAKNLERNSVLKEEQIERIIQQIESNSQLAEEETKREIDEHSKKTAEKINRLKRVEEVRGLFQSIKSLKTLFIMLFEKYVKTCVSNQQHLKDFTQHTQAREGYLMRYETVIKLVNAGQLTSAEVNNLETICDEIKESQRCVDEEIEQASEELTRAIAERNEREKLKLEEQQHQQQQQQEQQQQQQEQLQHQHQQQEKQQQHQQQQQQAIRSDVDTTDRPSFVAAIASNTIDNSERRNHYQNIMTFYEKYAESVKPLQNDVAMKKFRFECIKCVNLLSNSISSVSPNHLQDKYDRFALILSGNSVEIGGTRVTPSQHPLGIRFVNLYVAKMFVKQADTSMAVLNPTAGFPIASLIVALWQKFPEFGNLFLAYLYKQTALMVPLHKQQEHGQSDEDYLKSMGFVFKDNVCEDQGSFLKRVTGLVRLYASVIISKTRRQISKPHPHAIEHAWIWLTSLINLDPIADVSATMVYEFLVIAGSDLYKTYNRQFFKLIVMIHRSYMTRLNEIEAGGPKSRLENLIRRILDEKKIDPPTDALPANFW